MGRIFTDTPFPFTSVEPWDPSLKDFMVWEEYLLVLYKLRTGWYDHRTKTKQTDDVIFLSRYRWWHEDLDPKWFHKDRFYLPWPTVEEAAMVLLQDIPPGTKELSVLEPTREIMEMNGIDPPISLYRDTTVPRHKRFRLRSVWREEGWKC